MSQPVHLRAESVTMVAELVAASAQLSSISLVATTAVEFGTAQVTPATASYIASTLTINYTANGTTAEHVVITNDGVDIELTGDVSGTTTKAIIGVNKIVVQSSGTSTNQSFTFDIGSIEPYSLSGGFIATDVDEIWFDMAVTATGSGVVSVTAPKSIFINDVISSASSAITLKANTQVTPTPAVSLASRCTAIFKALPARITLEGRGGNDSIGSQIGVLIDLGASVGGTTLGKVSVTGTGGASTGPTNYGVAFVSGSEVTSGGGMSK